MGGIFKAYDVRGLYPTQLNEQVARDVGLAFRYLLNDEDRTHGNTVVVSRDMRVHSEPLREALIDGLLSGGLDVMDIGLATTPMNYFAVGHMKAAGGIQVTASHNPAEYNGLKFSHSEARPVSGDHGIPLLEARVEAQELPPADHKGRRSDGDIFDSYGEHVLSFLDPPEGRRLKVVVDAANRGDPSVGDVNLHRTARVAHPTEGRLGPIRCAGGHVVGTPGTFRTSRN